MRNPNKVCRLSCVNPYSARWRHLRKYSDPMWNLYSGIKVNRFHRMKNEDESYSAHVLFTCTQKFIDVKKSCCYTMDQVTNVSSLPHTLQQYDSSFINNYSSLLVVYIPQMSNFRHGNLSDRMLWSRFYRLKLTPYLKSSQHCIIWNVSYSGVEHIRSKI